MSQYILVIGGTGKMGRHIVRKLSERGELVTAMSRKANQHTDDELSGVTLRNGSILDAEAVQQAAADARAIVIVVEPSLNPLPNSNSAKHIFIDGHKNVIQAATPSGIPIILISQIYITRPEKEFFLQNAVRVRGKGEELLRSSGLPYTIIRAGWLKDTPGGKQGIRFEQGDTGDGDITREDVAEVCVQAIYHDTAQYTTFEIYNENGIPDNNWAKIFAGMQKD